MIEVAGDIRDRDDLPPACADVRDLIYAREEGTELTAEERARLDEHIARCEVCAAESRRVKSFTTNISDLLRTLRPAQDLRTKVLEKIEASARKRSSRAPLIALCSAALLAIVVIVAARTSPAARVVTASGTPVLRRSTGGQHVQIPFAEALLHGDQLVLAAGDAVTLRASDCEIALAGPAHVQLDVVVGAPVKVFAIEETHLTGRCGETGLLVRAGHVFVRATRSTFGVDVDRTGGCRISVAEGRAHVNTPLGTSVVSARSSMSVGQDGAPSSP